MGGDVMKIDEQILKHALFRYERFLKLAAKYDEQFLVPTLDIEMVREM